MNQRLNKMFKGKTHIKVILTIFLFFFSSSQMALRWAHAARQIHKRNESVSKQWQFPAAVADAQLANFLWPRAAGSCRAICCRSRFLFCTWTISCMTRRGLSAARNAHCSPEISLSPSREELALYRGLASRFRPPTTRKCLSIYHLDIDDMKRLINSWSAMLATLRWLDLLTLRMSSRSTMFRATLFSFCHQICD